MTIPFTIDEFFAVFTRYNAAIWPMQLVAYALGAIAIVALLADLRRGKPVILAVLAAFWLWNGIAYPWTFFAEINPAAYGFGAMFVLQGIVFAATAVTRNSLQFERSGGLRGVVAWALIIYAAVIYELLGYAAGHGLMNGPLFGVAPCPMTIFTMGVLLMASGRPAIWLSIIPIAWALVGTSAALFLGVPEDLGLAVAVIALLGMAMGFFVVHPRDPELMR
jgi:hypothetical protein